MIALVALIVLASLGTFLIGQRRALSGWALIAVAVLVFWLGH